MENLLAVLAKLTTVIETDTVVVAHQVEEMRALLTRTEAAHKRVAELRKVIHASKAYIAYQGPANVSKLIGIRQCRQRVEAAVAELDVISAEFQAITTAANHIMAARVLMSAFQTNAELSA